MKKHFTLFLAAAGIVSASFAQNIPNGDMESWNLMTDGNLGQQYNDLGPNTDRTQNFLRSLNEIFTVPLTPITCYKDTDAPDVHGGTSAARLVTGYVGAPFNILVPGTIITGDVDIAVQTLYAGRPYTQRPDSYTGWYKYEPVSGDSARFEVTLTRWDALNQTTVVVGYGNLVIHNAAATYTQFTCPINYTDPGTPDTAIVVAASSAGYNFSNLFASVGQVGSTMYIDDLNFEFGGVGVEEQSSASVKVFPTLTTGIVNIETDGSINENIIARVYDLTGKKVAEQLMNNFGSVDLTSFEAGTYVVVVQTPFHMLSTTRVVKH